MDMLKEIGLIEAKVRYISLEIRNMEEVKAATSVVSADKVQQSFSGSEVENYVIKLDEYYSELQSLLRKLVEMRKKLWIMVWALPRKEMIEAFAYTVLDNKKINTVAELMDYSSRNVRRVISDTKRLLAREAKDPIYMAAVDRAYETNRPLADVLREDFAYDKFDDIEKEEINKNDSEIIESVSKIIE